MSNFISSALRDVLGVVLMLALALVATYWMWLPRFLKAIARRNFIVTSIQEGTAKAFMTYGGFHRLALSWKGHYFDKDWNVIEGEEDPLVKNPDSDHWIDKFLPGGLRWVGFRDTIARYHFQWSSIRQGALGMAVQTDRGTEAIVEQGQLKDLLISRDEVPDYIYLKSDVYGITFQDMEDQDMIPLSFIAQFNANIENPYKALFRTEQWLERVTNFLRPQVKDYVGQRTFSELTGTVEDPTKPEVNRSKVQSDELLTKYMAPDGTPLGEYILRKWGVAIDSLNLVDFKTAGKRGEAYEAAAAEQYTQRQKAKGIVAISEAEAQREVNLSVSAATKITNIAVADAGAIKTEAAAIKEAGENGLEIRRWQGMESIASHGNLIITDGNQQMLINPGGSRGGKK